MVITHLGERRLQGTKVDRVSDSLGADGDGTNSGITLIPITYHASFDGTNDYVSIVDSSSNLIQGRSTWSISGWFKRNGSTDKYLVSQWGKGSSPDNRVFHIGIDSNGKLLFRQRTDGGQGASFTSNNAIPDNTWTHFAIVWQPNGSNWQAQMYINGTADNSKTDFANDMRGGSIAEPVYLGKNGSDATSPSGGGDYFNGGLYQILFYSSALTSANVTTLYNSGTPVTSPSTTGLVAKYNLSSDTNDSQGSLNGTNNGATFPTDVKLGTGAYSFDGSNDYVECGTTGTFNFLHTPNTKFTICGWFKRSTAEANSLETLLTTFNNGVSSASGIRIMYDDRSGESCDRSMRFNWQGNATDLNNETITHQVFPNDTDWHHLTVTGDLTTTTDAFKIYIDGTLKFSPNLTGTPIDEDHNIALRFGVEGDGTDYGNWNLDDWGFFNRVLTATEISDLVNKTGTTDGLGSDVDLTLSGTTSYATGLIGKCLYADFSGTESQQATPAGNFFSQARTNNDDFNFIHTAGQAWTINFWVKPTVAENGAIQQLIGNESYTGSTLSGFNIKILDRSASSEVRRVSTDFKNDGNVIYSAYNGTDGDMPNNTNWAMITVRCNGATTSGATALDININGGTSNNDFSTPNGTCTRSSSTATARNATYGLMFGRNLLKRWGSTNAHADPFDGSFDEVSIWNRELTDAECVALYNSGSGAVTTTAVTNHSELKAYWNFNDNVTNQASPVLTGALVSSLSDKSNLKANYTMDSTSLTTLKGTADYTEVFASDLPTSWAEDYATGYQGNFRGNYDGSSTANALWVDFNDGTSYNIRGWIDVKTSKSIDVSDTTWTLRYTLNINTFSTGGQILMGMSTNSSKYNQSQRFLGVRIKNGDDIRLLATSNGADEPSGSNDTPSAGYDMSTGTDYFVEIYRNSSTLGLKIRTGSHGGTLVHDVTQTISGSGAREHLAMDYIKFMNKNSGGSGEGIKAVFKDLKIYNDSATTTGCKNDHSSTSELDGYTNLPVNTIFEQIDDTPKYYWKQADNTWELDYHTFVANAHKSTGDGLFCGGGGSLTNNTSLATNYVWATNSANLPNNLAYSAGGGYKSSFQACGGYIASGSSFESSTIWDGTAWATAVALDTQRKDTTTYGGSPSSAIIALGRNTAGTEQDSSSKWNGTAWSSAGAVGSSTAEHVGGDGSDTSMLITGGSRGTYCDKWNGSSWSATTATPQTMTSHNHAGKNADTAHVAGGDNAYAYDWDGTTWTSVTTITLGSDTSPRYVSGGGNKDHHWVMCGLDGGSAMNNCTLWNGSSWTAKGNMTETQYGGLGDGTIR